MNLFSFDDEFYKKGFSVFAGIDEAGRGPWAGPVVTAAVIFPPNALLPGLNDSKKLSSKKREELFLRIHELALAVSIAIAEHDKIDSSNILLATLSAMKESVMSLARKPELILIDGNTKIPEIEIRQKSIIGGDQKSACIAAASIIAKVTRDRIMKEFSFKYPQYGFEKHKGYGTREHIKALETYGPCPIHRKSFEPVKKLLLNGNIQHG